MDIAKFKNMIASNGKDNLLKILANTRAKASQEHEKLAIAEINRRFPEWQDKPASTSRGQTPNLAIFDGRSSEFKTAKDGFIWLVEQMVSSNREVFRDCNQPLELAATTRRNYLARSPRKLFPGSEHLADDPNNFVQLPNGWYLDVNLPNAYKFEVLARLSWLLRLEFGKDWDWIIEGNNDEFDRRRQLQKKVHEIWKYFDDLSQ